MIFTRVLISACQGSQTGMAQYGMAWHEGLQLVLSLNEWYTYIIMRIGEIRGCEPHLTMSHVPLLFRTLAKSLRAHTHVSHHVN